ncbi:outer membrane protein assembly factor BamC [Haemophilus haemoglobinophilus]|nr:outer membrane protein assembly factor BamC [Canicola haemoglobinophilus]
MKKRLLTLTTISLLVACSTNNEDKQIANDSYQKKADSLVSTRSVLQSGGINLPQQDPTYQLPQVQIKSTEKVDIRPPSTPFATIGQSIAQFDGEKAFIIYPNTLQHVYNLQQIERLLKEQGIPYTNESGKIITDWTETGRNDDLKGTQIRYQIEHLNVNNSSALVIFINQMQRNGTIYTPNVADKQRYTSDRLNQLIGELNNTYSQQQQELNTASNAIQSMLITDTNGRTALGLNTTFEHAWNQLERALDKIGFSVKSSKAAKGQLELKYNPLDQEDWLRFGTTQPDLEKGIYYLQLSALGQQSSLVISDEEGKALSGNQAQGIYQALQNILAQ